MRANYLIKTEDDANLVPFDFGYARPEEGQVVMIGGRSYTITDVYHDLGRVFARRFTETNTAPAPVEVYAIANSSHMCVGHGDYEYVAAVLPGSKIYRNRNDAQRDLEAMQFRDYWGNPTRVLVTMTLV